MSVLLTFGVLYPPLAVIILIYMYTITYTWQSLMETIYEKMQYIIHRSGGDISDLSEKTGNIDGDYTFRASATTDIAGDEAVLDIDAFNAKHHSHYLSFEHMQLKTIIANIEYKSIELWKVLYDSRYILLNVSSLFYAAFLFDMVGDQPHVHQATVIAIPVSMVLVGIFVTRNKKKMYLRTKQFLVGCYHYCCSILCGSGGRNGNQRSLNRDLSITTATEGVELRDIE